MGYIFNNKVYPNKKIMHASLVALLKKKYVYADTVQELAKKYEISEEEIQEFYEMYSWNIRTFGSDDDNNIKLFLQDLSQCPKLSPTEERQMLLRYHAWDHSVKWIIIEHMAGYVICLAKKYTWFGIELLDLVAEWILWLERAITEFDPKKANRLSTYANAWINSYILCALARYNGTTAMPLHTINEIKFIDSIEQWLHIQYGRPPTQDEIVTAVKEAHHHWRNISPHRIVRLLTIKQGSIYLGQEFGDRGDTLGASIEDKSTLDPSEEAQRKYMKVNVLKLLSMVADPRDVTIIKMRYWLNWPVCTLQQIGEAIGVTRERIRQIEHRFINKIKTSPQLKMFLTV